MNANLIKSVFGIESIIKKGGENMKKHELKRKNTVKAFSIDIVSPLSDTCATRCDKGTAGPNRETKEKLIKPY